MRRPLKHKRYRSLRAVSLLTLVGVFSTLSAQDLPLSVPYSVEGVTYDTAIPTPEDVLGHKIGDRHTRPHEIVAYFEAVAETSNRVSVNVHGFSNEHRPLIHAVVTSPQRLNDLEAVRESNVRLSEEPDDVSDGEISELPVVVAMNYSVHGNEASGSEAAMLLLYHLAAGSGAPVDSLLDSAVILIDPALNPDGRDRFVDWANGNRGGTPTDDPSDREHVEPWPGGRTNHYWFDLNRDWLPAQQPETVARLELFHSWRPQVVVDVHEMGGDRTFFFQPGVPSRTNPNTPESTEKLTRELAKYNARALDKIGMPYFSEEVFDDFYYGKGSTYPDINGAVGILFEQASPRGLKRATTEGVLTYAGTVRNQLVTSLSTLRGAVEMRQALLQNQKDFYSDPEEKSGGAGAWIVSTEEHRTRAQMFLQMMLRHRVQLFELAKRIHVDGVDYTPGRAVVIPAGQPQWRLLKASMENVKSFRDSLFYDVSSWTMRHAFGLTAGTYTKDPEPITGNPIKEVTLDGGRLVGGRARVAYAMKWDTYYAPRALGRIHEGGITPRVAREPFTAVVDGEEISFAPGTILIPVRPRPDIEPRFVADVHRILEKAVSSDHVEVYALNTAMTGDGIDLGSPRAEAILMPKVALLAGSGVSAYRAGEIWHLLSKRMRIPVSMLDPARLDRYDLSNYQAVIIPSGRYDSIAGTTVDALNNWVRGGGRIIVLERAVDWAIRAGMLGESLVEEQDEDSTAMISFGTAAVKARARRIPGTILKVRLDTSHPIAYGQGQEMAVFRRHELVLSPSSTPGANVAWYKASPLISGYAKPERVRSLRHTASVIARKTGEGSVIAIMDSPTFRGFWLGSHGLLLNAIFFGNVL